jgi:hypothetical protein
MCLTLGSHAQQFSVWFWQWLHIIPSESSLVAPTARYVMTLSSTWVVNSAGLFLSSMASSVGDYARSNSNANAGYGVRRPEPEARPQRGPSAQHPLMIFPKHRRTTDAVARRWRHPCGAFRILIHLPALVQVIGQCCFFQCSCLTPTHNDNCELKSTLDNRVNWSEIVWGFAWIEFCGDSMPRNSEMDTSSRPWWFYNRLDSGRVCIFTSHWIEAISCTIYSSLDGYPHIGSVILRGAWPDSTNISRFFRMELLNHFMTHV